MVGVRPTNTTIDIVDRGVVPGIDTDLVLHVTEDIIQVLVVDLRVADILLVLHGRLQMKTKL